jgi:hypothetical protein
MDGVAELAAALREALGPRMAHRPTGAQAALQLTAQCPAALDEQRQVDRLVRHLHHRILRVGQRQPAGDLLLQGLNPIGWGCGRWIARCTTIVARRVGRLPSERISS